MEEKIVAQNQTINRSIDSVLNSAPWQSLEQHLNLVKEKIDDSIILSHRLREQYREELLNENPELLVKIRRPSSEMMDKAKNIFLNGTVAAADGTITTVPLLGGSKIQVGVVIVSNKGNVVDLVTRVFETEMIQSVDSAREFFDNLRSTRSISNLLSRAIMLYGERKLLFEHEANWRLIHGELIPHEMRTGAGNPAQNLPPTFELIHQYIERRNFIAISEAPEDIDILNAAIILQPGEYIEIRTLENSLALFLNGDSEIGMSAANFVQKDKERFRQFIASAGPNVSVVLVKAGIKPYLIECHNDQVEEAVAMFLIDSLWTRGLETDGSGFTIRGFPYHVDLADQVARTLFKGADFRHFVEARLFELGLESGVFDIDPRRTRR